MLYALGLDMIKEKVKFPILLPSVWPGADPDVQPAGDVK